MSSTVYLAGPITGQSFEKASEWRTAIENQLPIGVWAVSPLRGKEYLQDQQCLGHVYPQPLSTESAIVGRDFYDVTRCDIVCMNFLGAEDISIGSLVEIGWAYATRTPVLLIIEDEENPHDHPFVRRAAAWRVNNLDDAVTVLRATLEPY